MKITNNYYPENSVIPEEARIHVYNLSSPRSGNPVANQFVINVGYYGKRFQSYDTTCLKWDYENRILTIFPEAFNYSVTTSKYSTVFLRNELYLTESEIKQIKKWAKTESFGRDCPLYIEIERE